MNNEPQMNGQQPQTSANPQTGEPTSQLAEQPTSTYVTVPTPPAKTFWQKINVTGYREVLAIALIISGLVLGFMLAFLINFCIKDCNPTFAQETAWVWAPLASLLFTMPVAYLITKR